MLDAFAWFDMWSRCARRLFVQSPLLRQSRESIGVLPIFSAAFQIFWKTNILYGISNTLFLILFCCSLQGLIQDENFTEGIHALVKVVRSSYVEGSNIAVFEIEIFERSQAVCYCLCKLKAFTLKVINSLTERRSQYSMLDPYLR